MDNITKEHGVVKLFKELDNSKEFYLYFTSDEEIKEGDWYVYLSKRYKDYRLCKGTKFGKLEREDKKVVATTDLALKGRGNNIRIPQIPKSFVESYIKNPVDKVELEYKCIRLLSCPSKEKCKLKLHNNEVVIKEVTSLKESQRVGRIERVKTYTKEEVEKLCREALDYGRFSLSSMIADSVRVEQWIKENL